MDLLQSSRLASQPLFKNNKAEANHRVIILGSRRKHNLAQLLRQWLTSWQMAQLEAKPVQYFAAEQAKIWVLQPHHGELPQTEGHNQRLVISDYARFRDSIGAWWRSQKLAGEVVEFDLRELTDEETLGALVGLGLAQYNFLSCLKGEAKGPKWAFSAAGREIKKEIFTQAEAMVSGMNLARHLSNLPAEIANPADLADMCADFFKGRPGMKTEIWDVARLKKEKMGLLLGVGQGSQYGARFIHLKYRGAPVAKKSARAGKASRKSESAKPIAFVGKGVTFDTGGLDTKNSSGMRMMKKDVTGSAIMAGLAHYVSAAKLKVNCDFYLPLAENCVSDRATRPGDIHTSRAGYLVEIDNTDAEGRLVMADAFDVAVTQTGADEPAALVDVSTLTGAMRVAVGLDVAGFFSNNDKLARDFEVVAQEMGEMAWRMPLVDKYWRQLSSSFADFKNSTDSGFGGAITAALFLQKFVRKTPWVHFDVMAWGNSGDGAVGEGSNAQCFQILAGYINRRS